MKTNKVIGEERDRKCCEQVGPGVPPLTADVVVPHNKPKRGMGSFELFITDVIGNMRSAGEGALNVAPFSKGWRGELRRAFDALPLKDRQHYHLLSQSSKFEAKRLRAEYRQEVARCVPLPLMDAPTDLPVGDVIVRRGQCQLCNVAGGEAKWRVP